MKTVDLKRLLCYIFPMIKPAFMPSELTSFDVEKDVQNVLASLEGENTFLKEEILFLKEKLEYAETEHEKLMGYLRAMQQDKFGRKADVISDDKTGLLPGFEDIFDEVFEEEDEETSEDSEEAPGKKKKRKEERLSRKIFPVAVRFMTFLKRKRFVAVAACFKKLEKKFPKN